MVHLIQKILALLIKLVQLIMSACSILVIFCHVDGAHETRNSGMEKWGIIWNPQKDHLYSLLKLIRWLSVQTQRLLCHSTEVSKCNCKHYKNINCKEKRSCRPQFYSKYAPSKHQTIPNLPTSRHGQGTLWSSTELYNICSPAPEGI